MRIINHSGYFEYELTINGNKVGPNQEIIVGEMMFNSQAIFSDIGSVEIITEYGKRTFRCYGQLKAYESKDLKDASGLAAIIVINTIPQLHYKGDLISRSALKKDLASYDKEFAPDWVLNCIDNAPTGELQGEWIFCINHTTYKYPWGMYECSKCGHWVGKKTGICPNCKVLMKNGEK